MPQKLVTRREKSARAVAASAKVRPSGRRPGVTAEDEAAPEDAGAPPPGGGQ